MPLSLTRGNLHTSLYNMNTGAIYLVICGISNHLNSVRDCIYNFEVNHLSLLRKYIIALKFSYFWKKTHINIGNNDFLVFD